MVFTLRELSERGPIRPLHRPQAPLVIPAWRWLAFAAVAIALGHARLAGDALERRLDGGAFAPTHTAFAAWFLILLALAGHTVYQLAETQRRLAVYDHASRPIVAICALAIATTTASTAWLALACALGLVGVAALAYRRVHHEVAAQRAPRGLGVPFALVFGFAITVALAAVDTVLARLGASPYGSELAIAAAMVVIVHASLTQREVVLPAFAAWLFIGVSAEHAGAYASLLAGSVCVATATFVAAIGVLSPSRPAASLSPSPRSPRA